MASDGEDFPSSGSHTPVVLIVEDEALLRLSLADHLTDCGYFAIEATNAHEAIAIIQSQRSIDVVFTDVQMPGTIDGFGLAKWIRENRPDLAVFVASGFSGKLDLARELCSGELFFTKPYDLDLVTSRIEEHLQARRKPHN